MHEINRNTTQVYLLSTLHEKKSKISLILTLIRISLWKQDSLSQGKSTDDRSRAGGGWEALEGRSSTKQHRNISYQQTNLPEKFATC